MLVDEALVETAVRETAEHMADPSYAQNAIADFIGAQPHLSHYLGGVASKLGGQESVLQLLFHGQVLSQCFERALGSPLPQIEPTTLDLAADGDALERLNEREAALASYVVSNLDAPTSRRYLARIALAMSLVSRPKTRRRAR